MANPGDTPRIDTIESDIGDLQANYISQTVVSGDYTVVCSRIGSQVTVTFKRTDNSDFGSGFLAAGTVPAAYRPDRTHSILSTYFGADSAGALEVLTDGQINFSRVTLSTGITAGNFIGILNYSMTYNTTVSF